MKRFYITLLALASLVAAGCNKTEQQSTDVIGKPSVVVENGRFTPDIMWALGKKGEHAVSPNGEQMAYTVTYYDMAANKGNAEIYIMSTEGGEATQLTTTNVSEYNLQWLSDEELAFVQGGKIVKMNISTKAVQELSDEIEGLEGFKMSPDGNAIVFIKALPVNRPDNLQKLYEGLDKTTGRINEDLMYRHWDGWVDDIPHIFYATMDNGRVNTAEAKDLLDGEPYECPMRPMGRCV